MTAFVFCLVLLLGVILIWAFRTLFKDFTPFYPVPPTLVRSGLVQPETRPVGTVATPAPASAADSGLSPVRVVGEGTGPVDVGAGGSPATPVAGPAATGAKDDLRRMIGIGPANERHLNAHGVTTFAQIAAWTDEDVRTIEKVLAFDGRIARERWIEQARYLAAGDDAGFQRAFPHAGRADNT